MSVPVRDMFGSIARRYDLANAVLSLGVHRSWRHRLIKELAPVPGERLIDVACGTGDVTFALRRQVGPRGQVTGLDFCEPMLRLAWERQAARRVAEPGLRFVLGCALALPFDDASFDGATMAYGVRNLERPEQGLRELRRVVRPGGRICILEFGQPTAPLLAPAYRAYARHVLPRVGAWLTGNRTAYEYLPRTQAAFPCGPAFVSLLTEAGLEDARARPLTFGVAWIYRARVPEAPLVPAARPGTHSRQGRKGAA